MISTEVNYTAVSINPSPNMLQIPEKSSLEICNEKTNKIFTELETELYRLHLRYKYPLAYFGKKQALSGFLIVGTLAAIEVPLMVRFPSTALGIAFGLTAVPVVKLLFSYINNHLVTSEESQKLKKTFGFTLKSNEFTASTLEDYHHKLLALSDICFNADTYCMIRHVPVDVSTHIALIFTALYPNKFIKEINANSNDSKEKAEQDLQQDDAIQDLFYFIISDKCKKMLEYNQKVHNEVGRSLDREISKNVLRVDVNKVTSIVLDYIVEFEENENKEVLV